MSMVVRLPSSPHPLYQLQDLQRLAFRRDAPQRQRTLLTMADTHAAAHAQGFVDDGIAIHDRQGKELAGFCAVAAADTQVFVYCVEVAGGGQHGGAMLVSLHSSTAAGAAIADGIEAPQHGVLEEGVMHVAALV